MRLMPVDKTRRSTPGSEYLRELLAAKVAGFYVPEIEDVYCKSDNWQTPRALALDFGH